MGIGMHYAVVAVFTGVCLFGVGATAVILISQWRERRRNLERRRVIGKMLRDWRTEDSRKTLQWRIRERMLSEIIWKISTGNREQLEAHYQNICGKQFKDDDYAA